jgi:hypothetical protein
MSRSLQAAVGEGFREADGVDDDRDSEPSIDLIEKYGQGEAAGTS